MSAPATPVLPDTLNTIVSRLDAKPVGPDQWQARCPAHDDRTPSLSIGLTTDRVLLNCHAGCTPEAVVAKLELSMADLFLDRVASPFVAPTRSPAKKTHPTLDAAVRAARWGVGQQSKVDEAQVVERGRWTYRGADGAAAFHVVRFDLPSGDKQIRPIRPVAGGYQLGDPPKPLPLYNLPELAPAKTVFVVEGEKCAEAGRAIGLAATTSAHGAKAAADTDWSPLAGKEVVILPDHDDPGRQYAADVARLLLDLVPPARVKVVSLPDLGTGEDLVDFLEIRRRAGGAGFHDAHVGAEVLNLADATPPWSGDAAAAAAAATAGDGACDAGVRVTPALADPIPLDGRTPPPFPAGVLRGWFGDAVHAVAEGTETPVELPALLGLAAVATTVQNRVSVRPEPGYFEPLCVWTMCALVPGMRKSAVVRQMTAPLVEWERRQAATVGQERVLAESRRKTAEARVTELRARARKADGPEYASLVEEVARLEAELPGVPEVPRLFTQDCTPEHLGTMLHANGERLAILSDEGGFLDILAGRYSSGVPNLDLVLQAHAASPARVDRGSRPSVVLNHPTLTMGLSPQPDVLRGLTQHKGFRGRGLLARYLYGVPASTLGYRSLDARPVPEALAAEYERNLLALADLPAGEHPRALALSPGAWRAWKDWQHAVEGMMRPGGRLGELTDWGGKLPGATARLAGLLHAADHATCLAGVGEIPAETMARAVTLAECLLEHALLAFDLMGADEGHEAARRMWAVVEAQRWAEFSARDAWHRVKGRYKRMAEVEGGFDVLVEHNLIAERHSADYQRRGRPSRRFAVHPMIAEGWR